MTTQEKILRIARLEFANNGLEGARVDRIAENAGVNKAMIYYHFRSKDDLYQAVINEHMEQIANFLQRNIMEAGEYDNLFLRISEFLHALLKDRKEFMMDLMPMNITPNYEPPEHPEWTPLELLNQPPRQSQRQRLSTAPTRSSPPFDTDA